LPLVSNELAPFLRRWIIPASETRGSRRPASAGTSRGGRARLHWQQAFALQLFAREFTGTTDSFRFLSDSLLGRLFVVAAELHFAEHALSLHLLLEHPERLIDIVVTDEDLHATFPSIEWFNRPAIRPIGPGYPRLYWISCTAGGFLHRRQRVAFDGRYGRIEIGGFVNGTLKLIRPSIGMLT
jgi:hypothetical protein